LNLPINPDTLPVILSRTRDVDAPVRRLVYHSVLEPNCVIEQENEVTVGVTHPRALTIAQREQIVHNGLGDREDSVKNAAAKLVASWVDVVRMDGAKAEANVEADLIAFLNLFDLVENSTAEDALLSVFKSRSDILDNLEFGGKCLVLVLIRVASN
jgi:condensin complex subunit 3